MIIGQGFLLNPLQQGMLQGLKERLKGLNVDWPKADSIEVSTENGITTIEVCYESTKCEVHTKKKDDGPCIDIDFISESDGGMLLFKNHSRC